MGGGGDKRRGCSHLPHRIVARIQRACVARGISVQREVTVMFWEISHRLDPGCLPSFPDVTVKWYCSKCDERNLSKHSRPLKEVGGSEHQARTQMQSYSNLQSLGTSIGLTKKTFLLK